MNKTGNLEEEYKRSNITWWNKEDTIIAFTDRVLFMANNKKVPLMERVNYARIALSNLEEYIGNRLSRYGDKYFGYLGRNLELSFDRLLEISNEIIDTANKRDDVEVIPLRELHISKNDMIYYDVRFSKLVRDNFYIIIASKTDPKEHYMINLVNKPCKIIVPEGYSASIFKILNEVNKNFIIRSNKPKKKKVINGENSSDNKNEKKKKEKVYVLLWTTPLDYGFVSKALLDSTNQYNLNILPVEIEILDIHQTFKTNNKRLSFAPLNPKYKKIDFYKEFSVSTAKEFIFRTPFESFEYTLDFIDQMCTNPNITTIYVTLYRVASDSRIVKSLTKAIKRGKKCFVYIEASARGNERANIGIVKKFIKLKKQYSNLMLLYNFEGRKVHAKMFIAISKDHIFTHTATGNYNEKSARQYIDLHYITNNPIVGKLCMEICNSIIDPFHESLSKEYIFQTLMYNIEEQTNLGKDGLIRIKCNHIGDGLIVGALNRAVEKGCDVRIMVRTVIDAELNPNIKIRSRAGRYLEHERMYIFGHNDNCKCYIGSADLLYRNLHNRMETLIPMIDKSLKVYLYTLFDNQWKSKKKFKKKENSK